MNIAIVSLGCPKNQVDADVFCRALIEAGHETVPSIEQADAVIINTCGFIESAKEEAIENILIACAAKEQNPALKVLVTGCLAERYKEEIAAEIPEVDAVVGIGSNAALPGILQRVCAQLPDEVLQCYGAKKELPLGGARVISTPRHYAWLKIAEGCSNCCSYCSIPGIRGPLRSRPLADVVAEAEWLAAQGVAEVVLVAQDVTAYGDDRGENQLIPLLERLNGIEGLRWIRLLYAYPERITVELLRAMAALPKVLHYLDIPIQHISNEILHSMRRRGDAETIRQAVAMVRRELPDATLRTTLIAGYPGETKEQFEEVCAFVLEAEFDRLGCFPYSAEEGTAAAVMPGQVPEEERQRRADVIMQIQSRIMEKKQAEKIGGTLTVVCDEYDEDRQLWLCRSEADAPEIDAGVLVDSEAPLAPGGWYRVQVTGADVYDLYAHLANEEK